MRFLTTGDTLKCALYLTCYLWLVASSVYGKIAFYSRQNGVSEIYTMDSDGGLQTRLTHNDARDFSPVWHPNGGHIAFVSERDENLEIYVMDADGSNQRNLTRHPELDSSPDWSPDGKQIAFTSSRNGEVAFNIFVMDADGRNVRQLTRLKYAVSPQWSPDGKQIAFVAALVNNGEVYVMDANGTKQWQVSHPNPDAGMFLYDAWSPDGKQIVYLEAIGDSVKNATAIIATLDTRRREVVKHERVPLPKMDLGWTAWGADGKSILITLRKEEENWDIYRFRFSDGQLIQLTDHPASDGSPNEWNSRLPVSPQGLAPKRWGEIKSNSYHYRGIGNISIAPIP